MTVQDEHPFRGQENFGPMHEAIAAFVPDSLAQDKDLVASDHELVVSVNSTDGMVHFDADKLESVNPGSDQGSFVIRFKEALKEPKKLVGAISVVVTGSALLAAYIHQRRKK